MTKAADILAWHRDRPKLALFIHAPLCLVLLLAALIAQYGFGHAPCELCLWQRVPYAIIAVLAAVSLLKAKSWTPWILLLFAALYAFEAGLAIHHLGVERHWWQSAAGCGFQRTAEDIKELYRHLQNAPVIACDQPSWFFLGMSMAAWNTIVAAFLVAVTLAQAWVQRAWWTARRSE